MRYSYPADEPRLRIADRRAYLAKSREGFYQRSGTFSFDHNALTLIEPASPT